MSARAAIDPPPTGTLQVGRGRVEWQDRPTGLDRLRPRFHWTLAAVQPDARHLRQSAFRIELLSDDATPRVLHDSGKLVGAVPWHRPADDLPLASQSCYRWRLQVWDQHDRPAPAPWVGSFSTGLLRSADRRAHWIAGSEPGRPVARALEGRGTPAAQADPLPLFRHAFVLPARPVLAHLCIAGLGQYQLFLDGERLSPEGLNGHWTDYDRRVLYDSVDLTGRLGAGPHVLGVALGDGFFRVQALEGRYSKLQGGFGPPQLWLQLRVVDADGREQTIGSDADWQTRTGGTRFSSIYGGEDVDARRDDGRFSAGDGWQPARRVDGPAGTLQASSFAPMTAQRRLAAARPPRRVSSAPDTWVIDFGLNHAGRPDLTLRHTRPGQRISLFPAELLQADGTVDPSSMGAAPGGIAFHYTCRGDRGDGRAEHWQPQFTYTGYRYLQVTGIAAADLPGVQSVVLQAALDQAGDFTCTDPRLPAIHRLIRQALRSNLASVLTDCPHREKLGWLEEVYLNAPAVWMNVDAARLYEKIAADIRDSQLPSGLVPTTAPELVRFIDGNGHDTEYRDSPEWGAALVMACWAMHCQTGDLLVLQDNVDAMLARLAHLAARVGADGLLRGGLGDWYDLGPDKPGPAQLTSTTMTASATHAEELLVASRICARLGRPEAAALAARAAALRQTMQARLFDPATARFDTGSQTAQAMALVLDLVPADQRQRVLDRLVADIRARHDHVSAGDIGFHYVVRALMDNGRADVLYALLKRTDPPSYLGQLASGATALTESWDSTVKSSQNHFMLGHAEHWFYAGLGGLRLDLSGAPEQAIVLAPQPVAGIDGSAVWHDSVLGRIGCSLRRVGGHWELTADIPPGALAELRLPCTDLAAVADRGRPLAQAPGVLASRLDGGTAVLQVGSGRYVVTAPAG